MGLALSATMMAQGIIRHKTPVTPSSTKRQSAQPAVSPAKQQAVAQLIGNMVHVQGGTFTMGRTSSKAYWCDDSDQPAHQVTVGSFYICKYEVTQKLWKAFMGNNPSWTKADNMPVEWVNEAASYLSVPKELVLNFINSLVDNPKQVILSGKKGNSVFPPYTIVSMQSPSQIKRYSPNLFKYDQIDLRMKRHLTPSTITLMFNNICVTNCIYCYQDKSHVAKCTIPLERIKELIREAYKLNVNTFDVIGGEFFLYKYWRDVLAELRRYGYNPYLSTKMPLQENDVQFLAKLKVRDIQISLDSCIEEHLIESINVRKGYVAEMLKSLMLLEKYGILVKVHSVLTKYTKDIADMRSIYNVLKNLKNIEDWHVVKGEETLYPRTDYSNIEIDSLSYNNIVNYLKDLSDSSGMSIHYPKLEQIQIVNNTIDKLKQAESHFFNRAFCSGLFSSLYILPDGQVTMCEQLYWNKRFIIGNVKSNSILEIWNSKEAKSLYEIKQEDFPEDSLCHSCGKFKECRTFRQVCYRDIIRKYGSQKWYYPDVKCPYNNQK